MMLRLRRVTNFKRVLFWCNGGMAQNVGPILEMVTEKYLLRSEQEWNARRSMLEILEEILSALRRGDVAAIGAGTMRTSMNRSKRYSLGHELLY